MLQPADVLKIECKFVEQMIKFLNKRKYELDACYENVLPYFADAQLASTFYDAECLDHEDECRLLKKANMYSNQPELNPDITACADQGTITLFSKVVGCTPTVTVQNISGQAFPRIVLYNDSLYHDAFINIEVEDCVTGDQQSEEIRCGCTGTPEVCTDAQRVSAYMTFQLNTPATTYPGGYIQGLRLYATDSNGTLNPTAIDLDVSPANVGAWNACGTCSVVNGADLYFSSLNYKTAWLALMENISKTLYGGDYIEPNLTQGASTWLYTYRIKHNPASYWIGPNRNDFVALIYNGSTLVVGSTTASAIPQGSFLHQEIDFDVNCGTITAVADSFAGSAATPASNTNFNYLQFLTQDIVSLPISVSYSGDAPCSLTSLIATYSATSAIDSIEWRDPSNTLISSTNVARVNTTDTGTYTFKVILENGCVISETITV